MKINQRLKAVILIVLVLVAYLLLRTFVDFSSLTDLGYLQSTILGFGIWSPIMYILIMAIAIIISPVPSLPLDAVSGIIWGPYIGTLLSVIGAEIGAIISFLIARYIGKDYFENKLEKYTIFTDGQSQKSLTGLVFISRLFPFFQFDIISYGAGLTNIKLENFAIATFFGMIPVTFLVAYFGKALFVGNLVSIILSLILIILMFLVPLSFKQYQSRNQQKGLNNKKKK